MIRKILPKQYNNKHLLRSNNINVSIINNNKFNKKKFTNSNNKL